MQASANDAGMGADGLPRTQYHPIRIDRQTTCIGLPRTLPTGVRGYRAAGGGISDSCRLLYTAAGNGVSFREVPP